MGEVGESILGTIGIEPFLTGKPVFVGEMARKRAAALPLKMSKEARELLTGERQESREYGEFAWEDVVAATSSRLTPEMIKAQLGDLEPLLADDVVLCLTRALNYLRALIPKRPPRELFSMEPNPPTVFEQDRMRAAWEIANGPLTAMQDLTAWQMSRDQAAGLAAMYPVLYSIAQGDLEMGIEEERAKESKRVLPWQAEKQIRTFAAGKLDSALANMLQANTKSEATPKEMAAGTGELGGRAETPIGRVAGR